MSKTKTYKDWNRYDMLDFLLETTSEDFKHTLLDKIVTSMSNEEFVEIYEFICRTEGIARDYVELEELAQTDSVFEPELQH